MKYIKVKWIHQSNGDPIDLYGEIGDDMYEVRKVEVFGDGSLGYADEKNQSKDTILGGIPISYEEIKSQPEFRLTEIAKEEFEVLWNKAIGN